MEGLVLPETALTLALSLPFAAAILTLLLPRSFAELISLVSAVSTFLFTLVLLQAVRAGLVVSVIAGQLVPDLNIEFRVDSLGITFALLASFLWILTTIFSYGYVRDNSMTHLRRYFFCFALSIAAALGIAFAANLLIFLIFFEALTFATYPLVVHKETPEAINAGRRYLAYSLTGGLLMTVGIIWLWNFNGSLDFRAGGFVEEFSSQEMGVLFLLLMAGCIVKAAVMPFHSWLPSAMVAPSPVSALLHAVAVVKAGVFGCLRMTGYVFKPELMSGSFVQGLLVFLTAATILCGSLIALRQKNLKRRLAYSTVVHLSYIVLGAALLSQTAYVGSIFYMVDHALAKITLFFCAGAIYATTRFTEIDQLKGIGKQMPWTMGAFTIGSLGLIGVPGFCGFVGKLTLLRGALEAAEIVVMLIMIGTSLLTAAYLLPIVYSAFFEEADTSSVTIIADRGEARATLCFPLVVTAILTIAFGAVSYLIDIQYDLVNSAATKIFAVMSEAG